ncbi:subtilisin-like serine protease [Plasmodium cynomolgi strain B]|uniref:subtilisin n=1 Tax=Plasmodium cynomolgi (strain B) TaxID=1120755 RepID=K6UUD4_PLACD|nr:subtilisin-like serine protease [Plasmodium cynomolgi strain B]GAB66994.1 subtilisin-like serine protease [Plasmodium cynomolgi strain B]
MVDKGGIVDVGDMADKGGIVDVGGLYAIRAIGGEAPARSGTNLRSHAGSNGTFQLNNQMAFKNFLSRLQSNYKGTNIINGYDQTKMKEGTEMSEPHEQNDNYVSLFEALKTLEEKNILVVSSSGNCCPTTESMNTFPECNLDVKKVYPTAYSLNLRNLITVSNMIQQENGQVILSPDSCYSANYVHLAAPGDDIISTFPRNKYAISSGSSFSAAVVTGLAALVLSINARLSYEEVIDLLRGSIVQTESLRSKVKWGGFLDVRHLVSSTIALSRGEAEAARE